MYVVLFQGWRRHLIDKSLYTRTCEINDRNNIETECITCFAEQIMLCQPYDIVRNSLLHTFSMEIYAVPDPQTMIKHEQSYLQLT